MREQTREIKKAFRNDIGTVYRRYVVNNSKAERMSAESLAQSKRMRREHLVSNGSQIQKEAQTKASKMYCNAMIKMLEEVTA